jgi:hypothetical protein
MNTPVLQWEQLRDKKKKRLESLFLLDNLAEREGFEPSVGLTLRLISSQVHSTTLPPLRTEGQL